MSIEKSDATKRLEVVRLMKIGDSGHQVGVRYEKEDGRKAWLIWIYGVNEDNGKIGACVFMRDVSDLVMILKEVLEREGKE